MCRDQFRVRVFHLGYQGVNPGVEFVFQRFAGFVGADVFSLEYFEVVRYLGYQEDVGQARVDAAVGGGFFAVVLYRLLCRVGREEAGEVAVFVVAQRDEAESGKFVFACLRD